MKYADAPTLIQRKETVQVVSIAISSNTILTHITVPEKKIKFEKNWLQTKILTLKKKFDKN